MDIVEQAEKRDKLDNLIETVVYLVAFVLVGNWICG